MTAATKPFARRELGVSLDRADVRRLLDTARAFDINLGGHYDGRSGCVNVWCSPQDQPPCWKTPIDAGCLNFARAYVGELGWVWREGADPKAALSSVPTGVDLWQAYVEASPYDLLGHYRKLRRRADGSPLPFGERVPPAEDWASCLDWLEAHARELIRLSRLAPDVVGHACPFCDHVLPLDRLLNDLVDHIRRVHGVLVTSLSLGDPPLLRTTRGVFALRAVESFAPEGRP